MTDVEKISVLNNLPELKELRKVSASLASAVSSCAMQSLGETHLAGKEKDDFAKVMNKADEKYIFVSAWFKVSYPKAFVLKETSGKEITHRLKDYVQYLTDEHLNRALLSQKKEENDKKKSKTLAKKLAESEQKKKEEAAARAAGLSEKHKLVEAFIRETYAVMIVDGTLDEKQIQALVYILARTKEEIESFPTKRTPSRLYDWATLRSTITLPYATLSQAAEHAKFDKDFDLKAKWGFVDGKFIFPKLESLDSDDSFWGRLFDLLTILGQEVDFTAINDTTVPDIGLTNTVKNDYFSMVFIRLVELSKSPASATIRSGSKLSAIDIVKNHVDYVLLSILYQEERDYYCNLLFSPEVNSCQRTVKIARTVPDGKNKTKTVTHNTYQGYNLAEKLSSYLDERVGKSPEAEPFFRFIFEVIKIIAKKVDTEKYFLPRSMFSPGSIVVRKSLRQGPEIKSKSGSRSKANTYVPFSFAKSSECTEMPETLRKTLTNVGAEISKQIDSINGIELVTQNYIIPSVAKYVNLCYSLSDDLRKAWQNKAEIISDTKVLDVFLNVDFDKLSRKEENLKSLINQISNLVVKTKPLLDDKVKQSALQAQIVALVESKKKSRKTSS
jgi:hypothetical protein